MSRKRNSVPRDTAKDIILGLAPSGAGPREPREGIVPQTNEQPKQKTKSTPTSSTISTTIDHATIENLQNLFTRFQRQYKEHVNSVELVHKKLEANQLDLKQKLGTFDNNAISTHIDSLKTQLSDLNNKLLNLTQQFNAIKTTVGHQTTDLQKTREDIMDRVDIPTMKVINQRNESRFNDMNASISRLKEAIDAETNKTQKQNENLMQLQDRLKNIEKQRGDFQQERQRLAEQVMKLNEKIDQCITDTNKMERRFDEALKMEVKSRNEFEKHFKQKCDEDIGSCQKNVEAIKIAHAADKTKYKERLTKINEALANLEKHLETDNKKIDQIITTDIQSRRTHEKGLLAKVIEMEERIAKYMDDLKKMADSMAQGQRNVKTPALNVANLRREMESIATDKSKLSMEGLLKLEERLSNIQRKFSHEHDELLKKLHHSNEADVLDKFKMQIEQLNELKKSVEDANERLRMRVEQQIPNDLSELSAKTDRVTHQLETRINTEHEQRLTDVKQLQNRLNKVGNPGDDSKLAETFNEDLNGCKIAIKKLAESITTVKNVLDLKINDEIEQRKRAVNKLSLSTVPVANE